MPTGVRVRVPPPAPKRERHILMCLSLFGMMNRRRLYETNSVHTGHLLSGAVLADGGAAGDLRHGGGVRHRAHGGDHRRSQQVHFDALYTGYIASAPQVQQVMDFFDAVKSPDTLLIVDPAMADHGKLYSGFDGAFPAAMARLTARADVALPNITEACLLTGTPYREEVDEGFARELLRGVAALGAKKVILTGVSFAPDKLGAMGYDSGAGTYFTCLGPRNPASFHGTGDIFAAVVTGGLMRGMTLEQAASLAVEFVLACIDATARDPQAGWYGVEFEKALPLLCERVRDLPEN